MSLSLSVIRSDFIMMDSRVSRRSLPIELEKSFLGWRNSSAKTLAEWAHAWETVTLTLPPSNTHTSQTLPFTRAIFSWCINFFFQQGEHIPDRACSEELLTYIHSFRGFNSWSFDSKFLDSLWGRMPCLADGSVVEGILHSRQVAEKRCREERAGASYSL